MGEIEMLNRLLAEVQSCDAMLSDEALGKVICVLKGRALKCVRTCTGDDGSDEFQVYATSQSNGYLWADYRHRAPDNCIDAALALIHSAHALKSKPNSHGYAADPKGVQAYISLNQVASGHWMVDGSHRNSVPLAFLAAALGALIKQSAPTPEPAR